MEAYKLLEETPSAEQYADLRVRVGVYERNLEAVRIGLRSSVFSVCVRDESGLLVGMGRIVGDGGCHLQIVDVMVDQKHQKRGLAAGIMKRLKEWIEQNAPPTVSISLLADGSAHYLYRKFGFVPSKSLGMIYSL